MGSNCDSDVGDVVMMVTTVQMLARKKAWGGCSKKEAENDTVRRQRPTFKHDQPGNKN